MEISPLGIAGRYGKPIEWLAKLDASSVTTEANAIRIRQVIALVLISHGVNLAHVKMWSRALARTTAVALQKVVEGWLALNRDAFLLLYLAEAQVDTGLPKNLEDGSVRLAPFIDA